jgi:hypothetical protein
MRKVICPQCHDTHYCTGPTQQETQASQEVARFLEDTCEIAPHRGIQAIKLVNAYQTWAQHLNVPSLSLRRFGTTIRALGFTTTKATFVYYEGVGLKH